MSALKLDLSRLRRERMFPVVGEIPADAPLWTGTGLVFSTPLSFEGRASLTADGGVVVHGSLRGSAVYECGRCLEEAVFPVHLDLAMAFMAAEDWGQDDPDVRTITNNERVLELDENVREEVLLALPRYYVHPPKSGVDCSSSGEDDRETETASEDEIDPRWAALRALRDHNEVE